MTERLSDISARIEGVQQLGAVVNAIKGIAAARARIAKAQVAAVDRYSELISSALAYAMPPEDTVAPSRSSRRAAPLPRGVSSAQNVAIEQSAPGTALVLFLAEQGFAGAFSERVLDSVMPQITRGMTAPLMIIGTRGLVVASTREVTPEWSAAMPSHSLGIPTLADDITHAIDAAREQQPFTHLDIVYTRWLKGRPQLIRQPLLPLSRNGVMADAHKVSPVATHTGEASTYRRATPLMPLPREQLVTRLEQEHQHARLCQAALHAFAAENEARMEAMTSAATQIERELEDFKATLRQVRQESITAEIIELGTGAAAGNP
ncbi:F0F1 ATP synthase subunit gamma [Cobetia marina]